MKTAHPTVRWRQVDSKVGYDALRGLSASDSLHVWAVGVPDHVIHSINGGREWYSLVPTNLDHIDFVDSVEGWGTFNTNLYGLIRHTTDGGKTWIVQDDTTGMRLYDIQFVDSLHGVTVGEAGYALFTADGGRNWLRKPYPISTATMFSVRVLDTNHVWVSGNNYFDVNNDTSVVFFTSDWGASWQAQTLHDGIMYWVAITIDFIDSLNGFVLSEYGNGGEHHIYRTFDGGLTWNRILELSAFSNWSLFAMDAVDSQHMWMAGSLHHSGTSFAAFLSTSNGGTNWDTTATAIADQFSDIEMFNNNLGWACGGEGLLYIYSDLMLGDLNLDGQITTEDAVLELNKVFIGEVIPALPEAADVNCTQTLTAADVVLMLNKVFLGAGFPCSD